MSKRKHVKKNKPVARQDANQALIERAAKIKKQNDYIIKKIAAIRAHQEMKAMGDSTTHMAPVTANTGMINGLAQE